MTELERAIVESLTTSSKIKFNIRYVDDTLLLAKEDIMFFLDKFNSFHKNLKFAIHHFDDNNEHFLEIAIYKNKTEQNPLILVNILTLTPIFHGIIKLHELDTFTTDQRKFVHQVKINKIKMFMFWNGYPSFTRNSIIKRLKTSPKKIENEKR